MTMFGQSTRLFEPRWRGALADYVTAIAWSPSGQQFAATSAAGEVVLFADTTFECILLQAGDGTSVDCLAFSQDGQFLAAGGQTGKVQVWQLGERVEAIACLDKAPAWVDHLAWNPKSHEFALSVGKYLQVWEAASREVVATLNFDRSSVLALTWTTDGQRFSASGYQGVKVWEVGDWQKEPYVLTLPTVSTAIAWSPNSRYLACGNMDRTTAVWDWENPSSPWVMRGFPGKIRQLAWSDVDGRQQAPLLAAASAESIVVWEKHPDEAVGWKGRVLGSHEATIAAIAFQPQTKLLATAAQDGRVTLWHNSTRFAQTLEGAVGFTCLCWHPKGTRLAAGGSHGELLVWAQAMAGKGFGRSF